MNDSEFLKWIHARMQNKHGEDPLYDYMQKLLEIAEKLAEEERLRVYEEEHHKSHYGE